MENFLGTNIWKTWNEMPSNALVYWTALQAQPGKGACSASEGFELCVIIPYITPCCSVLYCLANQKGHKKPYSQALESLQGVGPRVISGTFRVTSSLAFNAENFIAPIDLQLQKLCLLTAARISLSTLNKLHLESRSIVNRHKLSSLERVQKEYDNQPGNDLIKNKRICSFTTSSWCILPYVLIDPCKNIAKQSTKSWRKSHTTNAVFLTYGSGINNKIWASAYLRGLN